MKNLFPKGSRMKILQQLSIVSAVCAGMAVPCFAGVTVASPTAGETVNSSFTLSANAAYCSSLPVSSMGYSYDSSATTTLNGSSINKTITGPAGKHTLHVKAWTKNGTGCMTDVTITIGTTTTSSGGGGTGGPTVPSNAIKLTSLQALTNWKSEHDAGTPGTASGSMSIASSPSKSGNARKFVTKFSSYGGERYSTSFADDVSAKNFVYDAWVFLNNTTTTMANLEMDMNQVMANGWTIIFGFQCDGWSKTWDYTANLGTPASPKDKWLHSTAACDPKKWKQNAWHHVQVSYSRDDYGYVTYNAVWLDGVKQTIGKKVKSAFALGWAPRLVTNIQLDSALSGSGSATVYFDNMAIYRW